MCRTRPFLDKNTRVIVLDKLTGREIYSVILLLSSGNTPNISTKFFHVKILIGSKFGYPIPWPSPHATPLQSQTCNRSVYHQKALKNHLICHFSVRKHYNSTLQQNLGTITNLRGLYLRTTSIVNLSPTQSPDIKIWFKFNSSFRAQTGLSTVGNRGFTNTL